MPRPSVANIFSFCLFIQQGIVAAQGGGRDRVTLHDITSARASQLSRPLPYEISSVIRT